MLINGDELNQQVRKKKKGPEGENYPDPQGSLGTEEKSRDKPKQDNGAVILKRRF